MKVVFATDINTENIHSWSGLAWYYRKMLEEACGTVTIIDKAGMRHPLLDKLETHFIQKVLRQPYSPRFNTAISKYYAKCIEKAAPPGSVVLSPNTVVLAYLNKSFKKVLYADATFDSLLHLYPKYKQYIARCRRDGEEIDRRAVANADRLIYTSQWAADSAIHHYGADPKKVFLVPFGANLDVVPTLDEVSASIKKRLQSKHLNLLFLGIDWVRKGGDAALRLTARLNEMGFPATLHIVGAVNLPPDLNEQFIVNHGYISKATPEGQAQIATLLSASHFLVLPTRADCTPVACSEANAYGVPCLTSDVGGLTSVIRNNVNGHTFRLDHFVEDAAAYIATQMVSEQTYTDLCHSAYHTYATELNWKSVGKRITQIISEI